MNFNLSLTKNLSSTRIRGRSVFRFERDGAQHDMCAL